MCDIGHAKKRIAYIKGKPNAFIILNGDICNWATKNSPSDMYGETLTPMEQIREFVNLFGEVANQVIAVQPGNHEMRSYRSEGIDITEIACREMGISDKYSRTASLIFLRFGLQSREAARGRKQRYAIYCAHGSGGGRKEGGKAIRLADMASIVDADVYIHSHTHLPMVMKQAFYRTDTNNSSVSLVDRLFINTAASLDYGGYGETYQFKPASKETPVIFLSGTQREMTARL